MSSKLLGIFGAFLLLCSCKGATDGYTFDGKQMENTNKQISFVLYPTPKALSDETARRHLKNAEAVFGFAVINEQRNTCQVHIVDPAVRYLPQELGHEITHCLYGNFHKSQP